MSCTQARPEANETTGITDRKSSSLIQTFNNISYLYPSLQKYPIHH